jgi:hypothetical protein
MKLPVRTARLIEKRSDPRDNVSLVNEIRDKIVNAKVEAYRTIDTTDATVTVIWSDEMSADSVGDFWLTVVGATAGAALVGGYIRRVTAKRAGTGAVAIVGAGADIIGVDHEDAAAWDVAFALDAAQPGLLFATVTGDVATAISWRARITGVIQPWE